MAFKKLMAISASGTSTNQWPASATLSVTGGGRPALWISLAPYFAAEIKVKHGDKFDLLIGSDDDQGTVRLVPNPAGLLAARRNAKTTGVKFFCGHIERFGTEKSRKQWCAAEVVDGGAIEITLPPWAMG